METKELTTHQRGVILRGICSDAEAFGLKPSFGYDGHTRITFTPKE